MKRIILLFLFALSSILFGQNPQKNLDSALTNFSEQLIQLEGFIKKQPPPLPPRPPKRPDSGKNGGLTPAPSPSEQPETTGDGKEALNILVTMYESAPSISVDNVPAIILRDWVHKFNAFLPQEKELISLIQSAGNRLKKLREDQSVDFKKADQEKFLKFLKSFIQDTKNWFYKFGDDVVYKGKDVPAYRELFSADDYAVFKESVQQYASLNESTDKKIQDFMSENKKYVEALTAWVDLPPTITLDKKKYSPLELAVRDNIINQLDTAQQEERVDRDIFVGFVKELQKIVNRNADQQVLGKYKDTYNKINIDNTGKSLGELTWAQDFKAYKKQLGAKLNQARTSYNQIKSEFMQKPIEQRDPEDYIKLNEAFRQLVRVQLPSDFQLTEYKQLLEKPREKTKQEIELKEELDAAKNKDDFDDESPNQIRNLIEKIDTYRILSNAANAYEDLRENLVEELSEKIKDQIDDKLNKDIDTLSKKEAQEIIKLITEYRELTGNPGAYPSQFIQLSQIKD